LNIWAGEIEEKISFLHLGCMKCSL